MGKNSMPYNAWEGFTIHPVDFKNKDIGVKQYVSYMLSRTQSMFRYDGLPETIPSRMLELYLQSNGNCVVSEVDGKLYAFTGGFGGVPDEYYRPTIYTVANPYLKLTAMYEIDKDCILVKNDSMLIGLLPMFERYATLLVENELTIDIALVMSRLTALLTAENDKVKASAELVIKRLFDGELGVISSSAMLDGIKSQPYGNNSGGNGYMQNLIEINQYFKGSWLNDIGLQYNTNTKRENLNKNETEMNSDYLLPLVDDMLKNRREAVNAINEMYGTEIKVDLASSWADEYDESLALEENSVQTEKNKVMEDTPENNEQIEIDTASNSESIEEQVEIDTDESDNEDVTDIVDGMVESLDISPQDENYESELDIIENKAIEVKEELTEELEGVANDEVVDS